MSVTVTEKADSRTLEGPGRFVWHYIVKGSNTIDDIATALVTSTLCPTNYGFWVRMWDQKVLTALGGGVWDCTVPYGVGDYPLLTIPSLPPGSSGGSTGGGSGGGAPPSIADGDPLGREWSVDFGQGTRLMTKSLSTEGGWWAEFTGGGVIQHQIAAETNGFVVGYDPMNGEVKGVEVPTCVQRMELQYKVPVLTMGYLKKLKSYSNNINSEVFLGQPVGSVKMVGANVQWSNANGYTVRIVVDIGVNQVSVRVSDDLPTTNVNAWQYLDVKYLPKPDTNSPSGVSSTVIGYIVHNVLESADLNDIFT